MVKTSRKFTFIVVILAALITMSAAAKNAVVTGANRGLGLELCRQLADGGVYNSVYAICRKTSEELTKLAAGSGEKVKIVENIEITKDDAASAVQKAFATNEASPTPIHLLVHNAGAYGPPENFSGPQDVYNSQALQNINAEKMRFTFDLNTVAPLVLTQALLPNMMAASKEGDPAKVAIVTSAMGSIAENGSGGHYAYRAAKAAVNMVGKSLAVDLKDKNIAVGLIHPGFVHTGFGMENQPKREGQRDVGESSRGVIEAIESTNLETTGTFYHGNYGEGVKTMPW